MTWLVYPRIINVVCEFRARSARALEIIHELDQVDMRIKEERIYKMNCIDGELVGRAMRIGDEIWALEFAACMSRYQMHYSSEWGNGHTIDTGIH